MSDASKKSGIVRRRIVSKVKHDQRQEKLDTLKHTKGRASKKAVHEKKDSVQQSSVPIETTSGKELNPNDAFVAESCASVAANSDKQFHKAITEEARQDCSVYSYDFKPKDAKLDIDWTRDDVQIKDSWFVPNQLKNVVGNQRSIDDLDKWLGLWVAKPLLLPKRCACFVRGPPGVGKTTAVRLALQKHGFNRIIEINASDQRSKEMVNRLKNLVLQSNVDGFFGRTAIVIEEVDGLHVGGATASLSAVSGDRSKNSTSGSASLGGASLSKKVSKLTDVEEEEARKQESGNEQQASSGAIGATGGGSSGSDALVKFLKSHGIAPKNCDRRGLNPSTAPAVRNETHVAFRSTVPILLLANDSPAAFMKKIAEFTLPLRFYSIDECFVRHRIVNQLSVALNVKWSKPKSDGPYQNTALYDVLVAHSAGDLRKATSLMMNAVRAAYSRRCSLPADHRDRKDDYLLIRREDCIAFFGNSKEDVTDSVPNLFGAARFLLCQMRCRCAPEQNCSCTVRRPNNMLVRPSDDGRNPSILPAHQRRSSVYQQAQRIVRHDIRGLPHMLFENSNSCAPEPQKSSSVADRLAASRVRCEMSEWFSISDTIRAHQLFLRNYAMQEFCLQCGMVAPSLLVRLPERYAPIAENSVQRPLAIERTNGGADINLQKSSLDGEKGNGAHTMRLAKDERNAYASHFNFPYQVKLSRWFDSDNYVSSVSQTRAQKQMLCQDTRNTRKKRKGRGDDGLITTQRTKMTKAQVESLRNEMRELDTKSATMPTAPSKGLQRKRVVKARKQ